MRVKSTGGGIDTPRVQCTSHKYKNKKYEDDDTSKIVDKDILEEDVYHTPIKSPTELKIYNRGQENKGSTLEWKIMNTDRYYTMQ